MGSSSSKSLLTESSSPQDINMDETVTSVTARRIFFFIFTPNVTMISIKIYCISELAYYEKQFFSHSVEQF